MRAMLFATRAPTASAASLWVEDEHELHGGNVA